MAVMAASKAIKPIKDTTAYLTASGWVNICPGCMTHPRIEISANVTPCPLFLLNARLDMTCPMKAMKTVMKDSSISFAKSENSIVALE